MDDRSLKVKDVVCGMLVDRHSYAIEYLSMRFAFCSKQCADRFKSNPHLYIGYPGHKAPKQEGHEIIKRRRLRLAAPLTDTKATEFIASFHAMMGVKHITINQSEINITYDLLQITEEQIESKIIELGGHLGEKWSERLRRIFVHYAEEMEVDALEEQPGGFRHRH